MKAVMKEILADFTLELFLVHWALRMHTVLPRLVRRRTIKLMSFLIRKDH